MSRLPRAIMFCASRKFRHLPVQVTHDRKLGVEQFLFGTSKPRNVLVQKHDIGVSADVLGREFRRRVDSSDIFKQFGATGQESHFRLERMVCGSP